MRWLWVGLGVLLLVGCAEVASAPAPELLAETAVTPIQISPHPTPACQWSGSGELRFLALGDSYTIGQGVTSAESWPYQLATRLRDRGVPVAEPEIIARTGWTTADLAQRIADTDVDGPFDLVSLQIGVNNQYQGLPLTQYRDEFSELLAQAVAFAGGEAGRVLVLSTPDYSVTPFANRFDQEQIAAEIDELNRVAQETAVTLDARYIDITPISRDAARIPQLIAADRLHPSPIMYNLWVEALLAEACAAIEN